MLMVPNSSLNYFAINSLFLHCFVPFLLFETLTFQLNGIFHMRHHEFLSLIQLEQILQRTSLIFHFSLSLSLSSSSRLSRISPTFLFPSKCLGLIQSVFFILYKSQHPTYSKAICVFDIFLYEDPCVGTKSPTNFQYYTVFSLLHMEKACRSRSTHSHYQYQWR